MRFFFSGPRFFGIRPGISLGANDMGFQTQARQQARQSQQSKGEPIQGSFVYVVTGDHNMVKIGVTTNPAARIGQLRTGSAFPITYAFLGITPTTGYEIEAKAHELLAHQRCVGEWFDVSPEAAMTAVMGAAAKLGQPLRPIDEASATKVLQMAANGGEAPQAPAPPINWLAVVFKTVIYIAALYILASVLVAKDAISEGVYDTLCALIPFIAVFAAYREARRP